jgi:hypothetical protein
MCVPLCRIRQTGYEDSTDIDAHRMLNYMNVCTSRLSSGVLTKFRYGRELSESEESFLFFFFFLHIGYLTHN